MPTVVTARNSGSFHTEVEARTHKFVMDEPSNDGGGDLGPTPYELMAAALAGCTAMTLHFYAKREGLPLERSDVSVTHDRQHAKDCADCLSTAGYVHRFRVDIKMHGPLTREQKQHLLTIAARCPVAKTLASEIKVDEFLVDDDAVETTPPG
ncbi:MAG TPA: OsmC family protein [Thermoanaerobaculia bacterium]|jgi:putative redox protein